MPSVSAEIQCFLGGMKARKHAVFRRNRMGVCMILDLQNWGAAPITSTRLSDVIFKCGPPAPLMMGELGSLGAGGWWWKVVISLFFFADETRKRKNQHMKKTAPFFDAFFQ